MHFPTGRSRRGALGPGPLRPRRESLLLEMAVEGERLVDAAAAHDSGVPSWPGTSRHIQPALS
jgi:hypothetical protein